MKKSGKSKDTEYSKGYLLMNHFIFEGALRQFSDHKFYKTRSCKNLFLDMPV